jgi:hypothetical protein
MDDDDDDRSSDSDFVPCNDANDSGDDRSDDENAEIPAISVSRKRKANDLWKELKEADDAAVASKMSKALICTGSNTMLTDGIEGKGVPKVDVVEKIAKKIKLKKLSEKNSKLNDMMSAVFGFSHKKIKRTHNVDINGDDEASKAARSAAIAEAARNVVRTTTVNETRKFAGKEITYVPKLLFS